MIYIYSKIKKIIKSLYYYFKYKIIYGKKIKMNMLNSFSGKFSLVLKKKSKCHIDDFIMTEGPMYIKGLANSKINIGKNCFFNHNCSVTSMNSINIGNDCMFGNNVTIVDHDHDIVNGKIAKNIYTTGQITIGDNVWCGANVVILKDVNIGSNSIIAAGAVVNRDIPDNEIWGGVPARKIRDIDAGGNL